MNSSTSSSSGARARPDARLLFLLLVGLAYALGFSEVYLRLFGSRYFGEPGRSYVRSPYLYTVVGGVPFRTNGWGLRGSEFRRGMLRVVTLGGSATEAAELPEEKTWTARLEAHLNGLSGGPAWQAVNAGSAGLASAHYLAHLEELGGPLGIDLAVIYTGVNDADRIARYGRVLAVDEIGDSEYAEAFFQAFSMPDPVRIAELARGFPMRRLRLALFLKTFAVKSLAQPMRNRIEDLIPGRALHDKRARLRASPEFDQVVARAALEYAHNIRLMISVARRLGTTPLFVTMPLLGEGGKDDPELRILNATLVSTCRDAGVPVVDLAGAPAPATGWSSRGSHHLTEEAGDRAGRLLAERIVGLLSGNAPDGSALRRRALERGVKAALGAGAARAGAP